MTPKDAHEATGDFADQVVAKSKEKRAEELADLTSLVLVLAYYVLATLALGVLVLSLLPMAMGEGAASAKLAAQPWTPAQALVLLGAIAGALGALLHGVRFTVHAAHRKFDWRWTSWHMLQPFKGALLGVALYFGAEAGAIILTGQEGTAVSAYAILFSCMVGGMFANATIKKLEKTLGGPAEQPKPTSVDEAKGGAPA